MAEHDRNVNRKKKVTGFTADPETLAMLAELATYHDRNKSNMVRVLIRQAHTSMKLEQGVA